VTALIVASETSVEILNMRTNVTVTGIAESKDFLIDFAVRVWSDSF